MSTPPPKKPRLSPPALSQSTSTATSTAQSLATPAAPDALISHADALAYWSAIPPTISGVLGGFPEVSRADLQGSANFLAKLRRTSSAKHARGNGKEDVGAGKLRRAVDCGAGIGRITRGLLRRVAEVVDVVEPVRAFTDQMVEDVAADDRDEAARAEGGKNVRLGLGSVGEVYNLGLEEWFPDRLERRPSYDLIWNQWCLGQLTDAQLVAYLRRLPPVLSEGGWIVVKENLSNAGEDVFDETDSSVTRMDEKFRELFAEAGLKVVMTELQKGLPVEGLFPVRAYGLQPVER